jgi:hypothetical protein
MAAFDQTDQTNYDRALDNVDEGHQRIDAAPTVPQQLGPFTVVCLVLNRTIGEPSPHDVITAPGMTDMILPLFRLWYICHSCYCTERHGQCWSLVATLGFWEHRRHLWIARLARAWPFHSFLSYTG